MQNMKFVRVVGRILLAPLANALALAAQAGDWTFDGTASVR